MIDVKSTIRMEQITSEHVVPNDIDVICLCREDEFTSIKEAHFITDVQQLQ